MIPVKVCRGLPVDPLDGLVRNSVGHADTDPVGVVERVRRQAETLRMQWQTEKEDAATVE